MQLKVPTDTEPMTLETEVTDTHMACTITLGNVTARVRLVDLLMVVNELTWGTSMSTIEHTQPH